MPFSDPSRDLIPLCEEWTCAYITLIPGLHPEGTPDPSLRVHEPLLGLVPAPCPLRTPRAHPSLLLQPTPFFCSQSPTAGPLTSAGIQQQQPTLPTCGAPEKCGTPPPNAKHLILPITQGVGSKRQGIFQVLPGSQSISTLKPNQ